jgi:hypothetical protein
VNDDTNPSPLDYAARLPRDTRTSKLAIVSLVTAVLGSPCLLGPLSDWINWYVPQSFRQTGIHGYVHRWFVFGAMILSTALSLTAVIRICRSRGALLGDRAAWAALILSLLWWSLPLGLLLLLWMGVEFLPTPH